MQFDHFQREDSQTVWELTLPAPKVVQLVVYATGFTATGHIEGDRAVMEPIDYDQGEFDGCALRMKETLFFIPSAGGVIITGEWTRKGSWCVEGDDEGGCAECGLFDEFAIISGAARE